MTFDSSTERSITIDIPGYAHPASWLIGATTYAVDRMVPDLERIYLPAAEHCAGTVKFSLSDRQVTIIAKPHSSRKLRFFNKFRRLHIIDLGSRAFFDAREDDYFNWSHQVNFYLTLAIAARAWAKEPIAVVLRADMPLIALDLYRMFGFEVIATDAPVRGRPCQWEVSHWEVVPSGRKLLAGGDHDLPHCDTPSKVFLARRGTRSIINEAEIEDALPGFVKIYPEDLSLVEQFALFRNATDMVAIHGAGIAPLQYRPSTAPPLRLVEIAPIGHMTRWFGMMCHQVGGRYAAARGKLKPEYVPYLYANRPYWKHSADRFEVDPRSVIAAQEIIA